MDMALKSIPRRVTDLEDRKGIVYSFMGDLRKWTLQLQGERREHKLRLRELEIGNEATREMIRAVNVLHADSQKRISQNEQEIRKSNELLQLMHERVTRLEDRQNGHKN